MKKLLIALLALSVAGVAFAADPALTFSGYVNSGLQYKMGDGNADALSAYAQDADVNGYRFNLDGAFVNGDYGVNFRLRAQGAPSDTYLADKDGVTLYDTGAKIASNYPFLAYGYGWANLFGGMAKVKAGLVDDGAWATAGDIGDDVGEGTGVLFQVMPMAGVNVGFGMYGTDNFGGSVRTFGDATYTAGFAYSMPNLLGIQASYKYNQGHADMALMGLTISAVPKLSANVELKLESLNKFSDKGLSTIVETLSYDLTPIMAGVTSYQWITQADVDDTFGYKVNPWVSYAFGNFLPKLSVTYLVNEKAGKTMDDTVLTVKPSVKYSFTDKANVTFAYAYDMVSEKADIDNNTQKVSIDFIYNY